MGSSVTGEQYRVRVPSACRCVRLLLFSPVGGAAVLQFSGGAAGGDAFAL
jgi:hypothetical protein